VARAINLMAGFVKDMSYLGPLTGIQSGPKDRYAKVLAIVHNAVPCREDLVGTKSSAVAITILRVLGAGFSTAPYTAAQKGKPAVQPKDGETLEPLFRFDSSVSPPELEVWSYLSKGMNRGIRTSGVKAIDAPSNAPAPPMYVIGSGSSFVFFVNSLTFQSAAQMSVLPSDIDYIPAMSIVELTISPRHNESCMNGRGINVKTMRMSSVEMDSIFQAGVETTGFPFTAVDANQRAMDTRMKYPALMKDIESDKVAFVVQSNNLTSAYMGDLPSITDTKMSDATTTNGDATTIISEYVKICVGGGTSSFPSCDFVDVPLAYLQKATNTKSDAHAVALLDVAFGLSAVDMFCITDDRWASRDGRSPYRAIPVINTTKLFAAIQGVRSISVDHAMVATSVNGILQMDSDGKEILERVDLHGDDDDTDNDEGESECNLLTLKTGIPYDDGELSLTVNVRDEDTTKTKPKSVHSQSNNALALVGPGVKTSKGYAFSFSVKCSDESRDIDGILTGYINRASGGGSSGISRKRKAVKME
jgi:hypothetical protein